MLDNCEQLEPEAIARLDAALPASWPVVATSRRPLGWSGERIVDVPPLDVQAARQVFLDAAPRGFDATAGALGNVLDQLDGLPLALRLAAGRLDVVDLATLEQLLAQHYLTVLADPDDLGRHGSLDQVMAWSWKLLDEQRRRALLTCAALGGPFDLKTASEVLEHALDDLHGLARHRLIEVDAGRYRLLEPIRQFALHQLEVSEIGPALRARVDEWWAARAHDWARALQGPGYADVVAAASRSWGGLTRLVEHAADQDARAAFSVLAEVVDVRGPAAEGIRWATTLAERAPHPGPATRAEALAWRSRWRRRLGAVDAAAADADTAVTLTDHGDPAARALMERAALRLQRGLSDTPSRRDEIEAALLRVEGPALKGALLAQRALVLHDMTPNDRPAPVDEAVAQAVEIADTLGSPAVQLQVQGPGGYDSSGTSP